MAVTPTTKWQVNGYRFLVRRMEHALVRRDVRMLHDPMRSQSRALVVGVVVASLGLGACGALALFRPQDKLGDSSIVVGKDSGAMFVAYDDTLRPVLNLASARLIADSADKPAVVKESELDTQPRGALVGIPGAPSDLSQGSQSPWSVCDTIASGNGSVTTSVLVGDTEMHDGVGQLGESDALLVSNSDKTYLVYDGKRARIDLSKPSITRALGIDDAKPRPVSKSLVNSIPEVTRIEAPAIPSSGGRPNFSLDGKKIGSVFQVHIGGDTEHYVVLKDGIQKISKAVASLIFYDNAQGDTEMASVSADAMGDIPTTTRGLPVDDFPSDVAEVKGQGENPVSCMTWRPLGDPSESSDGVPGATLELVAGRNLPIASDARPVRLAQADGGGDNADEVLVASCTGGFVQATGLEPGSTRRDGIFYIADTGVRFGVKDADTAKKLGLEDEPSRAPWPMMELLAPGPALSRDAALVAHDGVTPDSEGARPDSGS
ncbi:type VII secretion protein EccB [Rhodococcus sp. NPDC058521]|uniref:type VII secretion protein EccB n=1 Tax=Rhodococcus sp. NPDC058521 TaxID=3346536 RepID=UPI003646136A